MRSPALLLASVAVLQVACGSLDFDLTSPVPETRVAGDATVCTLGGLLEVAPLNPFVLDVDVEGATRARDTGPADRVELRSLTLVITPAARPPGDVDDFDFLDAVEVFVESARQGSTLPRVKVATLATVPRGATTLEVPAAPGVDLLPYIEQGARLTSTARATRPCDDVTLAGSAVVRVLF